MKYKLTIVILTHNSAGIVNNLVDALLMQDFKDPYEVIFMDNSSTDDTVKYLESTPFKNKTILNVPRGEFSHSGTRMKATLLAEGELMVFFTDDIIPLGKNFLSNLVKPVLEGNNGTVPHPGCVGGLRRRRFPAGERQQSGF